MIILITERVDQEDRYGNPTGSKRLIASHGVDTETGRNVVVSQDHPADLGAKFNITIGEWIIP